MSTTTTPDPKAARAYLGLIGLGAAIGIPAALVAALFLAVVDWCENWLWVDLPDSLGLSAPPWYLVIGLPIVGALIVWIARAFLPGDGGHSPILGIGGGAIPVRNGVGIALAAFGTLAFGAVLGPEAPLIALGSVVGTAVTPFASKASPRAGTVLATAGSFSAVSAVFGGPLVASILLLEAGLSAGAALTPALLPGLVAAAVGYVLIIGLGSWGGLDTAGLSVGDLPTYTGTHLLDLVLAIVVGVLAAATISPVRALAIRVDQRIPHGNRRAMLVGLLAGGAAVGVIAWVATELGGVSNEVLFSGQAAVPEIITEGSVGILLIVLAAKALGYAISLGCGFRGGPVFPAIFIGVTIATLCVALFDLSPTWAVAVGAAAGMTSGTGLVFSSLLFSLLLVGTEGLDALPAAVLAAVAAWLTKQYLDNKMARAAAPADAPT